jgi:hypothetical protein
LALLPIGAERKNSFYRVLLHNFDRFTGEYETIPQTLRVFFKFRRKLLGEFWGGEISSLRPALF